jgi:hypothetical protein
MLISGMLGAGIDGMLGTGASGGPNSGRAGGDALAGGMGIVGIDGDADDWASA